MRSLANCIMCMISALTSWAMTLLMRRKGRRVAVVGMSFMIVTRMVTMDVEAASCCEDD